MIIAQFLGGRMIRLVIARVGLVLVLALLGTACSSKDKKDTKPDPFTLTDRVDVVPEEVAQSNEIAITGIDSSTRARVSGAEGAELSINGGAFSAEGGSVKRGDRVVVRVPASDGFSETVNVTLSVGGVTDIFSVTTLAADIQPDPVEMAAKVDVGFSGWQESDEIVIRGVNTNTPISISNGEFKINDGEFRSDEFTVVEGDRVIVRVMSPIKAQQAAVATLSLGEEPNLETAEFSVTTGPDITPPEVAIHFPTPYTMTEGDSVFVRGTAKDVHGTLTAVTVNGESAELSEADSEGNITWTVTVPLNTGNTPDVITENTLTVTAMDAVENTNGGESIRVRRDPSSGSFPNNDVPIRIVGGDGDLALGNLERRLYIPDATGNKVIAIDIDSGIREVLWTYSTDDEFESLSSVVLGSNGNIFVSTSNAIYRINLETQMEEVLIDAGSDLFSSPFRMILSENGESLIIGDFKRVYSIDMRDLNVALITDSQVGGKGVGPEFEGSIWGLKFVDESLFLLTEESLFSVNPLNGDRVLVQEGIFERARNLEQYQNGLAVIDADSHSLSVTDFVGDAQFSIVSSNTIPNDTQLLEQPNSLNCLEEYLVCLLGDFRVNAVFVVDMISGNRMVMTKSQNN